MTHTHRCLVFFHTAVCHRGCLDVLHHLKMLTFHGHVWLGGRGKSHTVPDPGNKVAKDTPWYFYLSEIAIPEAMRDTELFRCDRKIQWTLLRSAIQEKGRYLQCRKQHIEPYRVSPKIRPGLMLMFFLQNMLWGSLSGAVLLKIMPGLIYRSGLIVGERW